MHRYILISPRMEKIRNQAPLVGDNPGQMEAKVVLTLQQHGNQEPKVGILKSLAVLTRDFAGQKNRDKGYNLPPTECKRCCMCGPWYLGNVGGQHDLPHSRWRWFKDFLLLLRGHLRNKQSMTGKWRRKHEKCVPS